MTWKESDLIRQAPLQTAEELARTGSTPCGLDQIPLSDTYNAARLVQAFGDRIRYCGAWNKWLVYEGGIWKIDHDLQIVEYAKQVALAMVREAASRIAQARSRGEEQADAFALSEPAGGGGAAEARPTAKTAKGQAHVAVVAGKSGANQEALEALKGAQAYYTHAKKSLDDWRLKAMCALARSVPPVPIAPDALDQHPMLLPCANGVIDLTTGTLYPHRPDYLFTRRLPVAYDPEATCPQWERFLLEIMGAPLGPDDPGDAAALHEARHQAQGRAERLVTFLQRSLGYSLSGLLSEEVFWILHGHGANGKSTLINVLLHLFGDYGMKTSPNLFLTKNGETHPTERADLFGRRFVATVETAENRSLDASFVKEATGRDPIRARRLYEDYWQFTPTHHIFLATNHIPKITDRSHGMWRRLRLIPFSVEFVDPEKATPEQLADPRVPKQNKQLERLLLDELPGILAWCVRGCLAWQHEGLSFPEDVLLATETYRREMDNVREFIESCCLLDPSVSVRAKTLFEAYSTWCTHNEREETSQHDFGSQLTAMGLEKGFARSMRRGLTWYSGIGIHPDVQDNLTPG